MSEVAGQADLAEKVRQLIRRDLKLGDDIALDDQTPLFDGSLDLDSLDALLRVSSIEKTFGIKIPNEAIGQQIFANIATLVGYLQEHPSGDQGASATAEASGDLEGLAERLPHGPAFRFVSRVTSLVPGVGGTAIWHLDGQEAFFESHFPGHPLVPGVLMTEALAQLSGIVGFADPAGHGPSKPAHLAHTDVRYLKPVEPPVDIELHAQLDKTLGDLKQFSVQAKVDGQTVAEGHISLASTTG